MALEFRRHIGHGSGRRRAARLESVRPAPMTGAGIPALDLSRPPWPGHPVWVGGAQIFIRPTPTSSPDAEPALYVHGLGGSSTNWTDMAAMLAPRLAGEAIDLPGFGQAGPSPDGDYSIAAHARLVIRYLESSGRGPVHLIGNSMGGTISIVVATSRPDLVRSLTLISPAVPDRKPGKRGDPRLAVVFLPGVGNRAMDRVNRAPVEDRVRGVLEMCFANPSLVPPHRFQEAVDEVRSRNGMRWAGPAVVASLRSIAGTYFVGGERGIWGRLARIGVPTLVIWGDHDRLVDVRVAARVALAIPDAKLLVLAGVGHVSQMEDPVSTAMAVAALVDSLPIHRGADQPHAVDRVGP
jgi:pimeloyl-ACP methyl ester carboxylesterase